MGSCKRRMASIKSSSVLDLLENMDKFIMSGSSIFSVCSAAGGPGAGEVEEDLPTYKDAFPPLPEKANTPEGTQETANAWQKLRPLKSSVITQVYSYFYFCHTHSDTPVA